ncbi:ABC transporter ATP-binding protein [Nocardia miyunensis]|uniref:ABC transporter ATP-binding protein n=1 Tax=Nocardia miyunensis TaxID=282684 RepID=UPI00082F7F58|nr:ABC transporter ATP-binding protein [Nocardia miyunensis]
MNPEQQPILSVRNVTKAFHPRGADPLQVISDVSMDISRGEFVSIVGPSGSGKSTVMSMLAGLEEPDSGLMLAEGTATHGLSSHCAYMPQKDLLFPWHTIVGNAALALRLQGRSRRRAESEVRDLLPTFGLEDFGDSYPWELSGGMRQRAALLRTVAIGRPILLLDEPFGALDYLTRTELQMWLATTAHEQGWTVVLITHDVPEAVLLSDRIYVLSQKPAVIDLVLDVGIPGKRTIDTLGHPDFARFEHILLERLTAVGRGRPTATSV